MNDPLHLYNPGQIGFWRTLWLMCTARGLEKPAENFDFGKCPIVPVVHRKRVYERRPANDNSRHPRAMQLYEAMLVEAEARALAAEREMHSAWNHIRYLQAPWYVRLKIRWRVYGPPKIVRWFLKDTKDYTRGTWIGIAAHVATCFVAVLRVLCGG